jgi:hypothetical protein
LVVLSLRTLIRAYLSSVKKMAGRSTPALPDTSFNPRRWGLERRELDVMT